MSVGRKQFCLSRGAMAAAVMIGLFGLLCGGLLFYSRVDNRITDEDSLYIGKILEEGGVSPFPGTGSSEYEIAFIGAVQKAVIQRIARGECLPRGTPREPKDVYRAGCGESYDRSRVIEKALRASGFRTRHVMVFSREPAVSRLKTLLSGGGRSHSLTEVKAAGGWLAVDPDDAWLSLTAQGEPLSLRSVQGDVERGDHVSRHGQAVIGPGIYREPFVSVYGLYSRHGKFYPPFNSIPDINWSEFLCNFIPE
jgi:hypothetical protein